MTLYRPKEEAFVKEESLICKLEEPYSLTFDYPTQEALVECTALIHYPTPGALLRIPEDP